MAILYPSRRTAFDANGNPISGATLTVYTTGTTTPAAIWRDAALTVAMSNPTTGADKADSAGRFPQIYTAENLVVDVVLKDAAGVLVTTELAVIGLGVSAGAFSRDFTNSRLSLRGSGGTVYVEAGDPSGDDVGGTMRIGGWLGTQADLITIDGAAIALTGKMTEAGYKLPGIVRTPGTTFTAPASVIIPLTNDPTGCRAWDVDIIDLYTDGGDLRFTLSYDGGATFVTTTTYSCALNIAHDTTNSAVGGATGLAFGRFGTLTYDPANTPGTLSFRVTTPNSGAASTVVTGVLSCWLASGPTPQIQHSTSYNSTGGRATHIKIYCTGAFVTGLYRVVPLRGFGE